VHAPAHHYAGINALSMSVIQAHLGGTADAHDIDNIAGGVRWAILAAQSRDGDDYWARITAAELCLLRGDAAAVAPSYRRATAVADRNWFALDSSLQTLQILRDLEFRPIETASAIAVIEREMASRRPEAEPRQVLLFSGHRIDAPDRATPRFPAA